MPGFRLPALAWSSSLVAVGALSLAASASAAVLSRTPPVPLKAASTPAASSQPAPALARSAGPASNPLSPPGATASRGAAAAPTAPASAGGLPRTGLPLPGETVLAGSLLSLGLVLRVGGARRRA